MSERPGPDSRDPALASERTDLSWNRSSLAFLALSVVVVRGLVGRTPTARHIAIGIVILLLGAAVWLLGAWHARRRLRRGPAPATARDLLPLSVGSAVVGLAAFALALLGPA